MIEEIAGTVRMLALVGAVLLGNTVVLMGCYQLAQVLGLIP